MLVRLPQPQRCIQLVKQDLGTGERKSAFAVWLRVKRAGTRAVALAALAVLGACAPQLAQMGVEMRVPAIEGDRYVTRDGLRLGLAHWDASDPHAVIVALHGMSDYSNAFATEAPWWSEHGISTYAYDQRGFGRSPNVGLWPGGEALRQDLGDFVDVVRARHPGIPIFVLGESMGGSVVMTAFASPSPPQAAGVILVSPAVWGWSTLPVSYRVSLWASAHLLPGLMLTGQGLNIMPSDNIEMLRANFRDPLFLKSTRTDAIYGLVNLMDEAFMDAPRMAPVPLLLVYGGKDQVIPPASTEAMARTLGPNATVKRYPNGYHMLLRDLDASARWADIAAWIAAKSGVQLSADAIGVGDKSEEPIPNTESALAAPEIR